MDHLLQKSVADLKKEARMKTLVIRLKRIDSNEPVGSAANPWNSTNQSELKPRGRVPAGTYPCENCGQKYASKRSLGKHLLRMHTITKHECSICSKKFKSLAEVKLHARVHFDEKPFKCEKCDNAFKRKISLNAHVARIHGNLSSSPNLTTRTRRKFECQVCGLRLASKDSLINHGRRKHQVVLDLYACSLCNKKFVTIGDLKAHALAHTAEMPFECGVCHKAFKRKKELKHVRRLHSHVQGSHTCPTCDKCFYTSGALRLHKDTHLEPSERIKEYECLLCTKKYFAKGALERHMRSHTGEKVFSCSVCNWSATTQRGLKLHIRSKHTHAGEKSFKCEECNAAFTGKSNLNLHVKRKHSVNRETHQRQCSQCHKMYASKEHLGRHVKRIHTHQNERPYVCTFCSKSFKTNSDLKNHMVTHTKEKAYKCTMCSSVYSAPIGLKGHILRVHDVTGSQNRKFDCHLCTKSFPVEEERAKHIKRFHESVKFACRYCGKLCSKKYILAAHERRMHTEIGRKPFSCILCSKSFKSKTELCEHIRIHTGEKYSCMFCSYSSISKQIFEAHVQRLHNNNT